VKLSPNLVEGRFIARLNRFAAMVEVDGQQALVHVANSGRLGELLVPGYRMLLKPAEGTLRKTHFDLALVDLGAILCSADARLPSALLSEAILAGGVEEFQGYTSLRREVTYHDSRLDLMLDGPAGGCYVETKSVTLVEEGMALFPDAPTLRGVKHLHSLIAAHGDGFRTAVVFVIQRDDPRAFSPHDLADPVFGRTLRAAVYAGVEALAYCCRVTREEVRLTQRVPVVL
jgi:sugar fermentation stimulation protein A